MGLPISGYKKLAPDRCLVEFARHPTDPPDDPADERRGGSQGKRGGAGGAMGGVGEGVGGGLVQDMRYYTKVVLQLYMYEPYPALYVHG